MVGNRARSRVGKRVRNRRGFTIVEVLIAVMVLIVGVVSFVGTTAAVVRMNSRGNRAAKASFYAQTQLETLMSTPCQLLADGSSTRGAFSQSWTVSTVISGNAKRVRVITSYPGTRNATRSDTMEVAILCLR